MEIKCIKCNSKERIEEGGMSTLAMGVSYYDENDVLHTTDPNKHTTFYRCAKCGHRYSLEVYKGVSTLKGE